MVAGKEADTIPSSLQLIAGRTGQQYNQRKQRRGAPLGRPLSCNGCGSGEYLIQCLVYIDLNMVRTGVVGHPNQWPCGGYREIQNQKQRYGIIDYERLIELLRMKNLAGVQESCKGRVEEALCREEQCRQAKWTESIAVGSEQYVGAIKKELGVRAKGRTVTEEGGSHQLRESETTYGSHYDTEKRAVRPCNTFLWNLTSDSSMS